MSRAHIALLGAAAAVVVVGSALHPLVTSAPQPPAVVVQPVESSRLVCPDPGASSNVQSAVTAFVVPGLAGQTGPGSAALATIPPQGTAVQREEIPGLGVARTLSTAGAPLPPVQASSSGSLAPGLVLDQVTLGEEGRTRGLASLECGPVGTDQWFVGGGSSVGRTTAVTLANPEDSPATVDVTLFGPGGPLPAPAGRGVFVPARGQVRLDLNTLAPGAADVAIHVQTLAGRVAAAVSDRWVNGLIPRGIDWVPSGTLPATTQIVSAIPAKVSPVRLSLLSPAHDAVVKIRLMTPSGAFAPAGLTSVALTAGQLEVIDITKVLRQQPAAVELVSTQPILGGAWYRLGDDTGIAEFAYAAGAPALTAPAAVAGLPTASGYRHRLYLTNPSPTTDAVVTVTTVDRAKKAVRTKLRIPAGTTQVWTAKSPSGGTYSLIVTPDKAVRTLRVSRVTSLPASTGTMASGVPMSPVRATVAVPEARANLAATLP